MEFHVMLSKQSWLWQLCFAVLCNNKPGSMTHRVAFCSTAACGDKLLHATEESARPKCVCRYLPQKYLPALFSSPLIAPY